MPKIKGILNHGQKARKSHLGTFSPIRSGATKSQVIEKTKPTPRALICPLVYKKKGEHTGPGVVEVIVCCAII